MIGIVEDGPQRLLLLRCPRCSGEMCFVVERDKIPLIAKFALENWEAHPCSRGGEPVKHEDLVALMVGS